MPRVLPWSVACISSLVRDQLTGRVIPTDDTTALADALKDILIDYDASLAWAEASQAEVVERFDLSREVTRLVRSIRSASNH